MDLTKEQMDNIVYQVCEKVFLRIPEIIGNLLQNHAMMSKLNKEFYEKNPEFKNDFQTVRSVLEQFERDNPEKSYSEILNIAEPEIHKRIKQIQTADCQNIKSRQDLDLNFNGEI